jgi:acetyl-CoA carboxylase carboxyltransferase component
MAHLTFMLARASRLYVSGPDVLRDAAGELATAEALGGAMLHATTSGIADRIFADEIELAQEASSFLLALRRAEVRTRVKYICVYIYTHAHAPHTHVHTHTHAKKAYNPWHT